MSPEAQRVAIAEACGWLDLTWVGLPKRLIGTTPSFDGARWVDKPVPNYLTDLNAMHEAETSLIRLGLSSAYYDELVAVTTVDRFQLVHATAAQRAEAFLRTINKWDDSK